MSQDLAIRTHQLTKQFDRQIAVNDIDLQVKTGEVYGLIGPNGAGKTTLIRLLAAAEEPTVGEIYINGERLRHDPEHAQSLVEPGMAPARDHGLGLVAVEGRGDQHALERRNGFFEDSFRIWRGRPRRRRRRHRARGTRVHPNRGTAENGRGLGGPNRGIGTWLP